MDWLTPQKTRVLAMAGYPSTHAQADNALRFAEAVIGRRTRVSWGESVAFSNRVRLEARSFVLPLPVDTLTVGSVTNLPAGSTTEIMDGSLIQIDAEGKDAVWLPNTYVVSGTRGVVAIPEAVVKASALLVNYYLGLSDSERSRYSTFAIGDFSGAPLLAQLPVPEADQLLRPWCNDVAGGLV